MMQPGKLSLSLSLQVGRSLSIASGEGMICDRGGSCSVWQTMSCFQAAAVKPYGYLVCRDGASPSRSFPSAHCVLPVDAGRSSGTSLKLSARKLLSPQFMPVPKHKPRLPVLNHHQLIPLGLFGGKGKSESENEGSAWKSLENAMGSFRKDKSIEDVLRQQLEKQEFYDDGGSGKGPPGGAGGSGGSGGGSGGTDDEGFSGIMDETVQVVLATLGFIFLYIYIITGEELFRLAKDYIKYLFGGSQSVRLRRAMYQWRRFYKKLTEKEEVDKYWLEKAIINTPTWWDSPEKYRRMARSFQEASHQSSRYDDEL
ncbi:uncharacterized protein LOC130139456 [Syzygium oleosum]|uniref:uncharacterized protein LOC130139456 n=2 Tax=Syzygium oleosum TaxID=219896 RepID=UPI0024BA8E41|nr:uncharacterized protein LOC130139456 [Syzygium oleosum]